MATPKLARIGGSKVRSGCITCKRRHLKCDEGKPSCQRCIRSKRECKGYVDLVKSAKPSRKGQAFVVYVPEPLYTMTSLPDMDWREKRSFNFFRNRTAGELAGHFRPELWSRFVLNTAHHEDAIKHAVIAIGGLHELFLCPSPSADPSLLAFAMQHYGRAMHHVVRLDTSKSARAVDVALTVSVLFACIEILRKHFASSLSHIYSGMRILAELARRSENTPEHYLPRHLLVQMYLRLDTQVMEFGKDGFQAPPAFAITSVTPIPTTFGDTDEARASFEMCRYQILHFARDVQAAKKKCDSPSAYLQDLDGRYQVLRQHFNEWVMAFQRMLQRKRSYDIAGLTLRASSIALDIILSSCMEHNEMVFDLLTHKFRELLMVSEEIVHAMLQDTRPRKTSKHLGTTCQDGTRAASTSTSVYRTEPVISMNLGIVPHLYMAATRCREPDIRQKSLYLLKIIKRREGICDSDTLAAFAEKFVTEEEERARTQMQGVHSDDKSQIKLHSSTQIPETVRIPVLQHRPRDLDAI
ncbi:uncharacterized protein Z520_11098 [Fonsecaea multimorphosa CBS 102226]|uniref:Zn(2)-C6 fungal-type domain-containing protein n=1 Tax=Fonsecaea multimorphosa CBS 102226 TaxID=1442371 RepID=A0A0D2KA18_9EURO|nr:uncharacterized protein Z520_11098 [Fonsecaea multimorphosa CBS 102226]KIX93243.1 hypothetical protein Z520_11098 [Fonsecaea multimorphosa CBS 102226]OAL18474.1 hypothetical protein AYO22_10670 [Fonsecaea multimorphosa]